MRLRERFLPQPLEPTDHPPPGPQMRAPPARLPRVPPAQNQPWHRLLVLLVLQLHEPPAQKQLWHELRAQIFLPLAAPFRRLPPLAFAPSLFILCPSFQTTEFTFATSPECYGSEPTALSN